MNRRVNTVLGNLGLMVAGGFAGLIAAYYQFGPPKNPDVSFPWFLVSTILIALGASRVHERRLHEEKAAKASGVAGTGRRSMKLGIRRVFEEIRLFHRRQLARCRSSPLKLIGWVARACSISLILGIFGMLLGWATLRLFTPGMDGVRFTSVVIQCGIWSALLPFAYCMFLVSRTAYILGEVGGDRKAVFRLLGMVGAVVFFYAFVYFLFVSVSPDSFKGIRSTDASGLIEDGVRKLLSTEQQEAGYGIAAFIDCVYFSIITIGTVGYGDISPVTALAKFVVCTEVFAGYFFLVIAISSALNRSTPNRSRKE